jgi:formamidopyrimidine-DNA glycosylase
MPELPEVETMRRGVSAIAGATIRDVERPACKKRPILIYPRIDILRKRVQGARIVGLGRVGKRVILELSSGDRLIFEPRM